MIRYSDLVQYTKENHVNWSTDLFDVLRGFFDSCSQKYSQPLPLPTSQSLAHSYEEVELFIHSATKFKEPADGEYTTEDLIDLFNI